MHCRSYSVAKCGHHDDENKDAFVIAADQGRFAVADGATESSFAAEWARLLARAYVARPAGSPFEWAEWLPPLQRRWLRYVGAKTLPWWAEAKLRRVGGASTFLGVTVRKGRSHGKRRGPRPWVAVAVGDSCVFHVRNSSLLFSFPYNSPSEFNSHPLLVGTYDNAEDVGRRMVGVARGTWRPGDTLILATDALSEWLLWRHEERKPPWRAFLGDACGTCQASEFAEWVNARRADRELRNDDTTAVVIRL